MKLYLKKREPPSIWFRFLLTTLSIIVAFALASILILQAGVNPLYAYYQLFYGALGDELALTETLVKFCPLLLCGLSVSVAFLCRFWNIGAEGQLYLGGLASAALGVYLIGTPSYLIIPLMASAGFLAGALWAAIPAYLKARLDVDEVVTTLLGNWIVYFMVSALLYGPWKNPITSWPESPPISEASRLPKLLPGTRLHLGVLFAVISALIYFIIYYKTMWGLELKAIGSNPRAAKIRGINTFRNFILAAVLSGGLAGLSGVFEVSGIYYRMKTDLSLGYGYSGIVIAMLGRLNPVGVSLGSLLLSVVITGSQAMHRVTGVPYPIAEVIQGLFLITLPISEFLAKYRVKVRAR